MNTWDKKIVYTPGVWDLLHYGHVNLLKRAKQEGEHLIVGVCSDRVCRQFGKNPVVNETDRASMVSALKEVDEVLVYDDPDQTAVLQKLQVDVFVVGEEFGHQGVPQHADALAYCERCGVPVVRLPRSQGISTSDLKRRVNDQKAGVVKNFWQSRGSKAKTKDLGLWQSTSLTASEADAEVRFDKDLTAVLKALERCTDRTKPHGILLELGCGAGRLTRVLANVFREVYASDFVQDFIDVAKEEVQFKHVHFFQAEAHDFDRTIDYEICLMAGLLVCLTDDQFAQVLEAIQDIPKVILKESVGTLTRYELANDHFSKELDANYTGIYRTVAEITEAFAAYGYRLKYSELVDRHRKETNLQVFVFEK